MSAVVPASRAPWVVLRASLIPTAAVGLVSILVCGLARGGAGALGALIGVVIVIAFFSAGQYALARILVTNPDMAMTGALTIYLVKVGVLFAFLAVFKNTTLFDSKAFAGTVLVCTLVWIVAEVWAMGRTKMLYVEPVPQNTVIAAEVAQVTPTAVVSAARDEERPL